MGIATARGFELRTIILTHIPGFLLFSRGKCREDTLSKILATIFYILFKFKIQVTKTSCLLILYACSHFNNTLCGNRCFGHTWNAEKVFACNLMVNGQVRPFFLFIARDWNTSILLFIFTPPPPSLTPLIRRKQKNVVAMATHNAMLEEETATSTNVLEHFSKVFGSQFRDSLLSRHARLMRYS